jgi:hypothetical protein
VNKGRDTDEYWGICIDSQVRIPDTVSYGKLLNEVVRRMIGKYPASLGQLYTALEMRFKTTR